MFEEISVFTGKNIALIVKWGYSPRESRTMVLVTNLFFLSLPTLVARDNSDIRGHIIYISHRECTPSSFNYPKNQLKLFVTMFLPRYLLLFLKMLSFIFLQQVLGQAEIDPSDEVGQFVKSYAQSSSLRSNHQNLQKEECNRYICTEDAIRVRKSWQVGKVSIF